MGALLGAGAACLSGAVRCSSRTGSRTGSARGSPLPSRASRGSRLSRTLRDSRTSRASRTSRESRAPRTSRGSLASRTSRPGGRGSTSTVRWKAGAAERSGATGIAGAGRGAGGRGAGGSFCRAISSGVEKSTCRILGLHRGQRRLCNASLALAASSSVVYVTKHLDLILSIQNSESTVSPNSNSSCFSWFRVKGRTRLRTNRVRVFGFLAGLGSFRTLSSLALLESGALSASAWMGFRSETGCPSSTTGLASLGCTTGAATACTLAGGSSEVLASSASSPLSGAGLSAEATGSSGTEARDSSFILLATGSRSGIRSFSALVEMLTEGPTTTLVEPHRLLR
uniref:Uncharacterized protein n=1 Tax=Ixodes ricinus TaxID=34613 RepID=A0A6B0V9Q6_IXORI